MINLPTKLSIYVSVVLVIFISILFLPVTVSAETCRFLPTYESCVPDNLAVCQVSDPAPSAGGTKRAQIFNNQGDPSTSCNSGTSCQASIPLYSGGGTADCHCWNTSSGYDEWISIDKCPPATPQCSDSSDNDGDGLNNSADPGCHSDFNVANSASYVSSDTDEANTAYQCSDGYDSATDTEDTLVDALDSGCHSDFNASNTASYVYTDNDETYVPPQCSDGSDNGDPEDSLSDINDPGCHTDSNVANPASYNATDTNETNATTYQCSDGADNADAEDTLADGYDTGCHSDFNASNVASFVANDNDETYVPVQAMTLTVNGSSNGPAPFDASFTVTVTGGSGNINYSIWWNCGNPSTNVSTVNGDPACGSISPPTQTNCISGANGHKCDNQAGTSATVTHTYSNFGSYVVKVIVERGAAVGSAYAVINVTGDTQSAWQVQVVNVGSGAVVYDSGQTNGTATDHYVTGQSFNFAGASNNFRAQVRVWDQAGNVSAWETMSLCTDSSGQPVLCNAGFASFKTPTHKFPEPGFNFSPTSVAVNQLVSFSANSGSPQSYCYDNTGAVVACPVNGYDWRFNGVLSTTHNATPTTKFGTLGAQLVDLTVTDAQGYACFINNAINIDATVPIPKWREILPF